MRLIWSLLIILACSGAWAALQGEDATPTEQESRRLDRVEVSGKSLPDPVWTTYRETYSAISEYQQVFREGDPVEPLLWLKPKGIDLPASKEVGLRLVGPSVNQPIDINHYWGQIPFSIAAAREGASLVANFSDDVFSLVRLIGIKKLASGEYSNEYLRSSCNRALEMLRSIDLAYKLRYAGKVCKGVRFYVEKDYGTEVARQNDSLVAESSDAPAEYSVLIYRFPVTGDVKPVYLARQPIAIRPIYER